MLGNVTALEGMHVTGKYRDISMGGRTSPRNLAKFLVGTIYQHHHVPTPLALHTCIPHRCVFSRECGGGQDLAAADAATVEAWCAVAG